MSFLAVVALGAMLLFGLATPREIAGLLLLAFAFAWLFGSDSRLAHTALIAAGVSIAAGPISWDWREARTALADYRATITDFERRIPVLAKLYPASEDPPNYGTVLRRFKGDLTADQLHAKAVEYRTRSVTRSTKVWERAAGKLDFESMWPKEQDEVLAEVAAGHFDIEGAQKTGYSKTEILEFLTIKGLPLGADLRPLHRVGPPKDVDALARKYGGTVTTNENEDVWEDVPPSYSDGRQYQYIKLFDKTYVAVPLTASARDRNELAERICRNFPYLRQWHCDALAAGVDMDAVPEYKRPNYVQPAPFMLTFSVFRNALWLIGGSLLALTGAGTMVASRFNMSSR